LAGVPLSANVAMAIDGNLLTVFGSAGVYGLQLDPTADFSGDVFYLIDDGTGHVDIVAAASLEVSADQTLRSPLVFNGATVTVLSGGRARDAGLRTGGLGWGH